MTKSISEIDTSVAPPLRSSVSSQPQLLDGNIPAGVHGRSTQWSGSQDPPLREPSVTSTLNVRRCSVVRARVPPCFFSVTTSPASSPPGIVTAPLSSPAPTVNVCVTAPRVRVSVYAPVTSRLQNTSPVTRSPWQRATPESEPTRPTGEDRVSFDPSSGCDATCTTTLSSSVTGVTNVATHV